MAREMLQIEETLRCAQQIAQQIGERLGPLFVNGIQAHSSVLPANTRVTGCSKNAWRATCNLSAWRKLNMIVAAPLFNSRIAPSFLHCDTMALARIVGTEAVALGNLKTGGLTEDERIKRLEESRVAILICGGIDRAVASEIEERGIKVYCNVAGEARDVFQAVAKDAVRSGFGISYKSAESRIDADSVFSCAPDDCLRCEARPCLQGLPCRRDTVLDGAAVAKGHLRNVMEAAEDVAAEPERVLCRLAELVYFGLGMKYERLGLAFCVDMFNEAERVARVLERFFTVVSVSCRIGSRGKDKIAAESSDDSAGAVCDSFAMAQTLNAAKTDLNVMMGLSVGSDVVFSQLSLAPATTLFVKDRLLANNPIAAVHSKHVLESVFGTY